MSDSADLPGGSGHTAELEKLCYNEDVWAVPVCGGDERADKGMVDISPILKKISHYESHLAKGKPEISYPQTVFKV